MEANNQSIFTYQMHPLIHEAYQCVHDWFDTIPDFQGYKSFTYQKDAQRVLQRENLVDAAFNFNLYFPTHYFKILHALKSDRVIGTDKLAAWLRYNPFLTIIDVGCGDGAGSAAVISTLLELRESNQLDNRRIQVYIAGVDPNPNGLVIFNQFLLDISKAASSFGIDIHLGISPRKVSEASGYVENQLLELRHSEWKQPSLSHSILIMSNLTDILFEDHQQENQKYQAYQKFGLSFPKPFGEPVSAFIRQIFEGIPVDHLHLLSVDTRPANIQSALSQMVGSIQFRMAEKGHLFEQEDIQLEQINIINPSSCYWENIQSNYQIAPFLVFTGHIHNYDLTTDARWKEIIKLENLELAWARARQEMLRESFTDEIEIRLFENSLNINLYRLSSELENYALHSGYIKQILRYGLPKSIEKDRPKGLTWLEEEILMVAIIQIVGISILRDKPWSYAYRLSSENSVERGATEYLYERWTPAWKQYRSDISDYARKYSNGLIYKTDIQSYYTRILQDRLKDMLNTELQISKRIEWLLELLVSKEIDDHDPGRGLVQGSIGSGFLANIYLSALDNLFPPNDDKKRRLFRYVDDIVVVIPDPSDEQTTKSIVNDVISTDLLLETNPEKTETHLAQDFLASSGSDELLDELYDRYEETLDPLWWMSDEFRLVFKNSSSNERLWWTKINDYRTCLTEAGFYLTAPWLSREISKKISKDIPLDIQINVPDMPSVVTISSAQAWADHLRTANPDWWLGVENLRNDLRTLYRQNYPIISTTSEEISKHDFDQASRRVRFAANRIGILGFTDIHESLTGLLCSNPWLIRIQSPLIDDLARQGYEADIWRIFDHHHSNGEREMSQYMSAISMRALRFIPRFEPEGWSKITDSMFDGSQLICLMATETWLILTAKMKSPPCAERIKDHLDRLFENSTQLSRRLLKNYLLVLGKLDRTRVQKMDEKQFITDPLLSQAFAVAKSGVQEEFLVHIEPEVIRQKYYSNKYQHFDDLGERS